MICALWEHAVPSEEELEEAGTESFVAAVSVTPVGVKDGDVNMNNIFLLDVDGVLNSVPVWAQDGESTECPWPSGWQTFRAQFHGNEYDINFAEDLTRELLEIHESGLAEVKWLTTWGAGANVYLAKRFGFPHFEVVGEPGFATEWWKFPLAKGVAEAADLVVWADDDLAMDPAPLRWANEQPHVLPLAPDPYIGLTPEDIQQARAFLRRHLEVPDTGALS
jgi:hypothetical protein